LNSLSPLAPALPLEVSETSGLLPSERRSEKSMSQHVVFKRQ
jgi:hypothetical protein